MLGAFLWQDSKAGNIDELRIRGLDRNIASGSRGDWVFFRQRGSLYDWGYRNRIGIAERHEDRVVFKTALDYPNGVRTIRSMCFNRGQP